jgi:hypothetical protein
MRVSTGRFIIMHRKGFYTTLENEIKSNLTVLNELEGRKPSIYEKMGFLSPSRKALGPRIDDDEKNHSQSRTGVH